MALVNRTIRFDEFVLKMAEDLGIDVNTTCRAALAKVVNERSLLAHDISLMNILVALREGMIDPEEAFQKLKHLED